MKEKAWIIQKKCHLDDPTDRTMAPMKQRLHTMQIKELQIKSLKV